MRPSCAVIVAGLFVVPSDYSLTAVSAQAQESQEAAPSDEAYNMFRQGRVRVSALVGVGYAFDQSYFLLGGGAGYYLVDGLEVGADTDFWIGPSPMLWSVSPGLRYVFHFVPVVKPYVGGFYRHRFIGDSVPDTDSLGTRLGVYFNWARGFYFGAGAVAEWYFNCEDTAYSDCVTLYPEISLAFVF